MTPSPHRVLARLFTPTAGLRPEGCGETARRTEVLEPARGWRLGPMASQNSSSVSAALLMGRAPRGLGSAPASQLILG